MTTNLKPRRKITTVKRNPRQNENRVKSKTAAKKTNYGKTKTAKTLNLYADSTNTVLKLSKREKNG